MSEKLKRTEHYSGQHRGVGFECVSRPTSEYARRDHPYRLVDWTHYVYVAEWQVPEELRSRVFLEPKVSKWTAASKHERVSFDYYGDCLLRDLEWHGGITFYDLLCAVPGHRIAKAGCDYQHLWDEGMEYGIETVEREARRTADSLHAAIPGLLVYCSLDGCFGPESSMVAWGDRLACATCRVAHDAKYPPKTDAAESAS